MDAINKIMQTPSPARHEPNHTTQFIPHTHPYIRYNVNINNHAQETGSQCLMLVLFSSLLCMLLLVALLLHKIIQIQMFDCVSTTEAARR